MGLFPDVKGLVSQMDSRFADLKSILEQMLEELRAIRAKLSEGAKS